MADNFLEELQAMKDEEAMAGLDQLLARDKMQSSLQSQQDMAGLAMMAAGPGKFKNLLGMIPKTFDKVDNLPALRKLMGEVKKLSPSDQKEAAGLLIPKFTETVSKIERTYANDILNNPQANQVAGKLMDTNNNYFKGFIQEMQKLSGGMNNGGLATLMPLKYGD
jgi:hypothetical protein